MQIFQIVTSNDSDETIVYISEKILDMIEGELIQIGSLGSRTLSTLFPIKASFCELLRTYNPLLSRNQAKKLAESTNNRSYVRNFFV